MNKKKFIALIMAVAVVISMTAFPIQAETDTDSLYIHAVWSLGIMESDNTDSFLAEETIERIDAIKYVLNFMNIKQYSGDGQRHFTDVSVYSDYYDLTTTAMMAGIIVGNNNGEFRPNDEVSYEEAIAMLLRAMGYDKLANAKGGSLTDYLLVANQYGFLNGISTTGTYITRGEMAHMFYNAFDIGIMEYTAFGATSTFGIDDDRKGLSMLGLKKAEGMVTANSVSSVYYSASPVSIGYVKINDNDFRVGNSNAGQYLGYNVEFYYEYDRDDENTGEIVLVSPKRNDSVTYSFEEGSFIVTGNDLYYTGNTGKKIKIPVTTESIIIKNGSSVPYDLGIFENTPSEGSVTFVENGSSGFYNVVIINAVANDIVRSIDTEAGVLNLKFGGAIQLPEEHTGGLIFVTKNGAPATLSDVKTGDTISYSIDDNSRSITIALSDVQASGSISEISSEYDRLKLTINGTAYLVDNVYFGSDANNLTQEVYEQYNIKLGNNVLAYISCSGSIVDLEVKSARNYGYVLDVGTDSTFGQNVQVKLFTVSGSAAVYDVASNVKIDGISAKSLSAAEICAKIKGQDELIAYELDGSGKISELLFPQEPSGNLYVDQGRFVRTYTLVNAAQYSGATLGGIGANNTYLFSIPQAADGEIIDEDDCDCTLNGLVRGTSYRNVILYDVGLNGVASVALQRASVSGYNTTPTRSYVVRNVVAAVLPDGDSGYKLNYISNGSNGSIYIADETLNLSEGGNGDIQAQDLQFGDIITFEADKAGKMKKFSVLYRDERQANSNGVIYVAGDGILNSREILLMKGTAQYINGDTLSISYTLGGRTCYEIFSGFSKQTLTVINMKEKEVETREVGSIIPTAFSLTGETPGDTIFVNANRNVLNEVIVYEYE